MTPPTHRKVAAPRYLAEQHRRLELRKSGEAEQPVGRLGARQPDERMPLAA